VIRILLLLLIVSSLALVWWFDLGHYLQLSVLKEQQTALQSYQASQPLYTALMFFLAYVFVAAFSIPGAALMTLAAGALFGLGQGLVIASFASTIGATLAFLMSRSLLREVVQRKFGSHLQSINQGVEQDGAFYLFGLRLVPLFPFFVVNLVMGLTPIRLWTYFWVSQVGMLAGTAVYVNAGTQLARLESLADIGSPALLISFALLGLFPIAAKKLMSTLRAQRSSAEDSDSSHA